MRMPVGEAMDTVEKKIESSCEVRPSQVGAGLGTFASRDLTAGEHIFAEFAFLIANPHTRSRPPAKLCADLSAICIQQGSLPPCIRLATNDTGGVLSGSLDSYCFAQAYARASMEERREVLLLSAPGGDDTHAIVRVVRAEVVVLRNMDAEIRAISPNELERAILRYWANTFGREGSLHARGSRFNHSCVPNCTHAETRSTGDPAPTSTATATKKIFLTLRPVARGEELTLSYLPSKLEVMGTVVRRRHLWLSRGFMCSCTLCSEAQDHLRRVKCPDCTSRTRLSRFHPSQSNAATCGGRPSGDKGTISTPWSRMLPLGSLEEIVPETSTEEAFADWWNESGIWVCRWCGWCSDPAGALHRREGALSAEIFSLVMAQTIAEEDGQSGLSSTERRDRLEEDKNGGGVWALREADSRRLASTIEDLLRVSVGTLGRRHWVTFCCLLLRLELDMVQLESGTSALPTSTTLAALDRAMIDLNGIWEWLELTPVTLPPESYLFDVVCAMAVEGLGRGRGCWGAARELLTRVDAWASAFADSHQRGQLEKSHAIVSWRLRNDGIAEHCSQKLSS